MNSTIRKGIESVTFHSVEFGGIKGEKGITVEAFIRYFEETAGIQFIDFATGMPVMELVRKQPHKLPVKKSDYELWLEQQEVAVRLEHKMGAL
ncbi:MAG: hypothetical protein ACLQVD_05535 [Capsulimonadaceae bacterium]